MYWKSTLCHASFSGLGIHKWRRERGQGVVGRDWVSVWERERERESVVHKCYRDKGRKGWESAWSRVGIILTVRTTISWIVPFGQRSEDGEGRSHVSKWGKNVPNRGKNKCKISHARSCLLCSINTQQTRIIGEQLERGWKFRDETR